MDLLDRYLHAVTFWLPNRQKQDIIAELSEDIRSQIEDREAELGRPLAELEVGAILRHVGRPVLVANRYLPQQHLIGPVWFPIYLFVLKMVVAFYLVPRILVWIGLLIFHPRYRVEYSGWTDKLGAVWGDFWIAALVVVGTVTVVFAVLERVQARSRFLDNWDPSKLPPARDPNRIPRGSSVIEMVVNIVFCGWWIGVMSSPVIGGDPLRITLAPMWQYFFWGMLLLSIASIGFAGMNVLRPYWTRPRAGMRTVINLCSSALFGWMFWMGIVANISVANVSPAETLVITNAINLWMSRAFPIVVAVGLVVLAFDVRRMIRVKTS